MLSRPDGQKLAVMARAPSVIQVLGQHFFSYAAAVAVLMLGLLAASQMLIRFLLSHLNTLRTSCVARRAQRRPAGTRAAGQP